MAKKQSSKMHEEVLGSMNKVWLAGLGALSVAEEEGGKMFSRLVDKGETFEAIGKDGYAKLKEAVNATADKAKASAGTTRGKVEETVDRQVTAALSRLGVPSRKEIAALTKKVEQLTKAVEALRGGAAAPGSKPAKGTSTRKTASAKRATPVEKTTTAKKTPPAKKATPRRAATKKTTS